MIRRELLHPRRARSSALVLLLLIQPLLAAAFLWYRHELLIPIARATHWVVHPDVIPVITGIVVVVVGIVLWHGRLRPVDIGIVRSHIPIALATAAILWIGMQLIMAAAALIGGGGLEPHQDWAVHGAMPTVVFLAVSLLLLAPYEEISYRGFLFPQLVLRLRGSEHLRVWGAAVVSQVAFALVHIPNRLLVAQIGGALLLQHLLVLTFAGLVGVLLYVRTGNLFVVAAVHALVNAPTPLYASPVEPFHVTAALTALLWLSWPRIERRIAPVPWT